MSFLITLFSFKGSISRKNYWLLIIAWIITWLTFVLLDANYNGFMHDVIFGFASLITFLAAISFFALQVKRCHDIGWSGWLVLLSFVPYVQWVWWLTLGTMTKQDIQEAENRRKEREKEKEERQKKARQEADKRRREEAAIKRRQEEAEDRIQRAEDLILSSGDPKAISLLLLARKMPTNYPQILAGGMKNGNSTLKKALAVMTGAVAGNLVATTVSVAAIQDALENMQPEIQNALEDMQPEIDTMDLDSFDEVELPDEKLALDAESGSDFDLSNFFD